MTPPAGTGLERILEEGDFEGVFFFHGDAHRLRDDGARRFLEAASDPATRDFNLDLFHGDEVEPGDLASALATPPMMAERRVVAVFEAQRLTPTGRKVVESVLEDPPSHLTLLVVAAIPSGSRAAFYTRLRKGARCLEWTVPSPEELPGWLMERARTLGFELEPPGATALASAVGPDAGLLEAELEKLAASAGGGKVDRARVEGLVARVRKVDRWEWLDAVAGRRYGEALEALPALLAESSESAVGLLVGMIDQHLYLGVALEGGRGAVSEALSAAGKPYLGWKARIYAGQARGWSRPELERALGLMRRVDRQVKTGRGDRAALEELLLSLRLLREEAA